MGFEQKVCDFFRNKVSKCQYMAMISTIVFGFIAHGYMLCNKLCYHDDSYAYFHVGSSFHSGRWFLGVIRECFLKVGIQNYSTPFWNGIIYIFFLAIVSGLLVALLDIKQPISAILVGAVLIVFPTTTSVFAYMFTAPYYGLAIFLVTFAVYVVAKNKKYGVFWGIVFLVLGMGIYQAYFGIATTLFILILLLSREEIAEKWKSAWKYLGVLCAGMIGYFICNKICLFLTKINLVDYQGVNEITSISVNGILHAIWHAYRDFLLPLHGDFYGISAILWVRILYFAIFTIFLIVLLVDFGEKKSILEKLFQLGLYFLIPLSINIVYVMTSSDASVIHTLMVFPYVFAIIYPIPFILKTNKLKWMKNVYYLVTVLLIIFYGKLDNTAYLKMTHQQEVAISYYNTVISEIKGLDGYEPNMPVLFYGQRNITDRTISYFPEYDAITLKGYSTNEYEFMSYYVDDNFLKIHCGYQYQNAPNRAQIVESEEFVSMPCYPCAGAVGIIDDTIVVKFSESE